MKGTIHKTESGWVVWYGTPRTDNQNGSYLASLPLHPDNVKEINEWAQVFDNIEGRIASDNEVEFEIIPCIPEDLEPTRGETLAFESIKYAKLIHNGLEDEDTSDWDVTLMDGLEDEEFTPGLDKETLDELFTAHEPEDFIQDCVDKDFEK
jgi:hypothetical protein